MVDQQQEELINKLFNAKADDWKAATDNGDLMQCLLIPDEYKLSEEEYDTIMYCGYTFPYTTFESFVKAVSGMTHRSTSPTVVKAVLDGDYFSQLGFIIAGYDEDEFLIRCALCELVHYF